MPMNERKMSEDMLSFYRSNMKSISPEATPTDFQKELCDAIAIGTIEVLKKAKTVGAGNDLPQSGVGLVADPQLMINTATTTMKIFSGGQGGVALPKMMESLFIPLAAHLAKNVEIKSTSGFGGQGGPPVGATAPMFEVAIFNKLKNETKKQMTKSAQGKNFIKAISIGLGAGMATAVPGVVVATGTNPGALVGIFK